jgi:hypothetical protein
VDDKVKAIILKKLNDWEGESLNTEKLGELREIITKKTGKHKFLAYDNLRKWIREVKKEMRATTSTVKKRVPETQTVQKTQTPQHTASEVVARAQQMEVPQQKAVISPFADRVYFQNLTYELSSMRRTLERISKQIDDLEGQLKEFKDRDE